MLSGLREKLRTSAVETDYQLNLSGKVQMTEDFGKVFVVDDKDGRVSHKSVYSCEKLKVSPQKTSLEGNLCGVVHCHCKDACTEKECGTPRLTNVRFGGFAPITTTKLSQLEINLKRTADEKRRNFLYK